MEMEEVMPEYMTGLPLLPRCQSHTCRGNFFWEVCAFSLPYAYNGSSGYFSEKDSSGEVLMEGLLKVDDLILIKEC